MNEIYKLEQCPRGKQDLQRIVENIKLSECMTVAIEFDNQILKSVNLNKNQFLKGKYNAK